MTIGAMKGECVAKSFKRPKTKLGWALLQARMGFNVFPLKENDIVPMPGVNWRFEATTDLTQIRRWWKRWPNANIGLAYGWPTPPLSDDGGGAA